MKSFLYSFLYLPSSYDEYLTYKSLILKNKILKNIQKRNQVDARKN